MDVAVYGQESPESCLCANAVWSLSRQDDFSIVRVANACRLLLTNVYKC